MNGLGIALGGLAIQITLAMLPAMVLHLLASRRGPVAGSWMAAASLAMIVGISVLAIVPRPNFQLLVALGEAQSPASDVASTVMNQANSPESAADTPVASRFINLAHVHAIWRSVGSRLILPAARSHAGLGSSAGSP